ncbi:hypothetical protein MTO96_004746 [Rhipicephalus appendiculatus]
MGPAAAVVLLWACVVQPTPAQLIINVRNAGGDLLRERLLANTSDETITLEFQRADGTHVTQLIDFRAEVQVFRVVVLAEEEQGHREPQVLCFLIRFNRLGFISVDAMSKLRQRNPLAEREPEDDRGRELVQLDLSVDLSRAGLISPHVATLCADAPPGDLCSTRGHAGVGCFTCTPSIWPGPTFAGNCCTSSTGNNRSSCRAALWCPVSHDIGSVWMSLAAVRCLVSVWPQVVPRRPPSCLPLRHSLVPQVPRVPLSRDRPHAVPLGRCLHFLMVAGVACPP